MQGKVILPDGKICSGKSTYSRKLRDELGGVMLVVDEAILSVFGEEGTAAAMGPELGHIYGNLINYVMGLAADFALHGTTVILESGYFTNEERNWYKQFFRDRNVPFEWHYLDVNDETWRKNLESRESKKDAGETTTYRITEDFLKRFNENYVTPSREDVDVWIDNNW